MITFWQILAVGAFGGVVGYLAHWWTARNEMRKLRGELTAYVDTVNELHHGLQVVRWTLEAPDPEPLSPEALLRDAEAFAAVDEAIARGETPF